MLYSKLINFIIQWAISVRWVIGVDVALLKIVV